MQQHIIHFATASHPFAELLLARDSLGVCAILLGDNQATLVADLHQRFAKAQRVESTTAVSHEIQQVKAFLTRPVRSLKLRLSLHGTAFQQKVWQALQEIPLGTTTSYSKIAQQIGQPKAARAVARACASNPVALAVACHRVLRSDGSISGYRWGVERKIKLLKHEKAHAQSTVSSTRTEQI